LFVSVCLETSNNVLVSGTHPEALAEVWTLWVLTGYFYVVFRLSKFSESESI